ncbi:AraC family transcriptional regulator [Paenibacillus sp. sptzw28]|nr:AraC family transcriptional regulator [Paenibacillus sp. sptzw28]
MTFLKTSIKKPVEFISCGHFMSDAPWRHANRSIDSFEIIIGVHKCLYIEQNLRQYEVKPGDVLLLLPGSAHNGYKECEEGVSFFWFHFLTNEHYELLDEGCLDDELSDLNKPDFVKFCSNVYLPILSKPAAIEKVNILFQQLQHVANANYYSRQAAHYIATSLLIELSEQMISDHQKSPEKPQGERNIAAIIEWIRIHALEDLQVSMIAEKFNYNKDYLSRFFKKRTGYNLQEYIHLIKVSKAKDLLTRSSRSIKSISEKIGIHDDKYFMRLFKTYENMTPTEYRKAFYKNHTNNH